MKHWIASICLACATAPVLAQPSDTTRATEAATFGDIRRSEWQFQRTTLLSDAEKAVQAVIDAVTKRDCAAAVAALNGGLSKAYPEVLLLAASMYEEGICLKPNWDRAVTFYQRALAAGQSTAAARLAAGYAAPVGGSDKAAALWWALRAKTGVPEECSRVASLVDDADRFIAALGAWPASRLDACAYAAAVMAMIQGDIGAPALAAAYGMEGKIKVVFVPGEGRVDVADNDVRAAAVSGLQSAGAASDNNNQAVRKVLLAHLRYVSERAIQRYAKPAVVDASWKATMDFEFKSAVR